MPSRDESPTAAEMIGEVFDLLTGLGVLLLPIIILAVPCLILLLPLALLALPLALLAPPILLIRWVRGRRRGTPRTAPPRASVAPGVARPA